jgi:heme-degrading monooxygenase HmoA
MTSPKSAAFHLSNYRDDFRMSTWMLAGASLQAISFLLLGQHALMVTGILLVYQCGMGILQDKGIIKTDKSENVNWGKWTIQLPYSRSGTTAKESNPGDEQVVVFLLGSRSSHPRGRFTPGFKVMGAYITDMWLDLDKNQQINGFLGKSPLLHATNESAGNTMCWLSYWKDMDSLQAFANSPVHKEGMSWYLKTALKEHPSIGIMHETYRIPRGYWESVSHNMRPFGLSDTKLFIQDKETGAVKEVRPLMEARGKEWENMRDRMAAQ